MARRKSDAGEVFVTVSATAATWALAPFIQSMASKAADGAYQTVRAWLGSFVMPQRKRGRRGARPTVVVLRSGDGKLSLVCELNLPDEALRALPAAIERLKDCDATVVSISMEWDSRRQKWVCSFSRDVRTKHGATG